MGLLLILASIEVSVFLDLSYNQALSRRFCGGKVERAVKAPLPCFWGEYGNGPVSRYAAVSRMSKAELSRKAGQLRQVIRAGVPENVVTLAAYRDMLRAHSVSSPGSPNRKRIDGGDGNTRDRG